MSPRAAWRLEALGYNPVYDYVAGKADWLAAGLPTGGDRPHAPRAADAIDRSVPTCTPHDRIANVAAGLARSSSPMCVVVNDHRIVQGRLRRDRLDPADTRTAEDVMEPGPATIRADADLAETLERMTARNVTSLIVSTPDGVLLGALYNNLRTDPPQ
jgi:predicted transcriptional regulator